ncbi:MAG: hypothetical protein OWQ57_00045 [Sulfobacillus sp.]|nr:hypothetical protein [Sulfobacillus sp.]
MLDTLIAAYYDLAAEGLGLKEFLEKAGQGAFGPVSRAELLAFIDQMEIVVLANITEHQHDLSPYSPHDVDAIRESWQREFWEARQWVWSQTSLA